jgi:hypothetical protein
VLCPSIPSADQRRSAFTVGGINSRALPDEKLDDPVRAAIRGTVDRGYPSSSARLRALAEGGLAHVAGARSAESELAEHLKVQAD